MNKIIRLKVLLLGLILIMNGCSSSENKKTDVTQSEDTVTVNTVSVDKIDLSSQFDTIGVMQTLSSGSLLIGGRRNGDAYFAIVQTENKSVSSSISIPDELKSAPIYGVCTHQSGGFTVYFESQLLHFNESGEILQSINIPDDMPLYAGLMETDDRGYLFWDIYTLSLFNIRENTRNTKIYQELEIHNVFTSDRKIYVYVYDSNASEYQIRPLNVTTMALDDPISALDASTIVHTLFEGYHDSFAYNNGISLYEYNSETGIAEKRFDWAQVGLRGEDIFSVIKINPTTVICASKGDNCLQYISMENEQHERTKITVGTTTWMPHEIEHYVADFNANNDQYYAEIVYYDHDNQDLIRTDLIAGTAPDVLMMNEIYIPVTEDKFIDLLPFLDADEEISRDDFNSHIFDLMLIDGRMLYAFDSYELYTLTARTADVGNISTWTTRDVIELLNNHPERYAFSNWMTEENTLGWSSLFSIGQFVDLDTATCDFKNDDFYELLDFCKIIGGRLASMNVLDWDDSILLQFENTQNEWTLNGIKRNYGSMDITFIGFPNNSGINGSYISRSAFDLCFAVPLSTENKEAAWDFIKGIYRDEWQMKTSSFPIITSAFNNRIEQLLGDPDAILTREDCDKFVDVIENVPMFFYPDTAMYDIIYEEAVFFLNGQKSAEEVASLIQSRIGLMLSERQ